MYTIKFILGFISSLMYTWSSWEFSKNLQQELTELEIKYVLCGGHEPASKHMRFDRMKIDFSGLSEEGHTEFCVNWRKQHDENSN